MTAPAAGFKTASPFAVADYARFFASWLRRIAPDTHQDQASGAESACRPGGLAAPEERWCRNASIGFIVIERPQEWSAVRQVKAQLLGASDLPVNSFNAPALMITDTAFFRNPHYHRAGDVADTLDYERMAKVIQGVFALVQNYDAVR